MVNNKVDPKGMLDLLELLKKESEEMPGMMKYLSTHPDTDIRISTVRSDKSIQQTFTADKNLEGRFLKLKNAIH